MASGVSDRGTVVSITESLGVVSWSSLLWVGIGTVVKWWCCVEFGDGGVGVGPGDGVVLVGDVWCAVVVGGGRISRVGSASGRCMSGGRGIGMAAGASDGGFISCITEFERVGVFIWASIRRVTDCTPGAGIPFGVSGIRKSGVMSGVGVFGVDVCCVFVGVGVFVAIGVVVIGVVVSGVVVGGDIVIHICVTIGSVISITV